MRIDRIHEIGASPDIKGHEVQNPLKSKEKGNAVSVDISQESQKALGAQKIIKLVNETVDTERAEKVQSIKEKMANNEYDNISTEQLNKLAENIGRTLGIL